MKHTFFFLFFILFTNEYLCQTGFPKQFQTILNITGLYSWQTSTHGVQQLLYDYTNLRVRFDIQGWRSQQNETYMIKYKPEGAEAGSPASQGYSMFNFNPDYPELTKNDCWYRTDPMGDIGPFPISWFYGQEKPFEIQPWFPLPSNLINKGEEWIPEIQKNAIRYDSPELCDLVNSGYGIVPCLSYFEAQDTPVKTIRARAASGFYDSDEYVSTVYLSFTKGIPSETEYLFNLPNQWPSYCGNANTGFTVEPMHGFVVTPDGQDHFALKLQTPPVRSLGDQIEVEFRVQPSWYYNGTRCAEFNSIVFNQDNWHEPQQVDMSFDDYGCCTYAITATGGGYEWQYAVSTFVVYACDGQAGYGCRGKQPCGA
ncbi:unnamed protein product [Rotaria magnacalcarata]|uniref:Uncharacterized protein n=2 Tax=Rotaria magnacalcarata TaxID=392030 RepID=A0A816LX88_9BILA|nr:unnamed protein product [Rotaria magnacalcarata]CAF1953794.1 unnamed protein product [Rotaria magnacalcarata]